MEKTLKQFLMVAEMKSVSHAAKRLFISQPTITHNMKKLEENLGVELFIRSSKGMDLTPYGEVLLEQTRIMRWIDDTTFTRIEQLRIKRERGLRIGVGLAWWHLFFKNLFHDYRIENPTAPAHIEIGNHMRSMDQLLSGDIDLFIGDKIVALNPRSGAKFIPLFQSYDASYVRENHPMLGNPCSLDDLMVYPHLEVTPDETRYTQQVIENSQHKEAKRKLYHLTDRVVWSTNSMGASIDILLDSDAVMNYPTSMKKYFANYCVVPLDIVEIQGPIIAGVYVLNDRAKDENINHIIELMKRYLKEEKTRIKIMF